MPSLGLDISRIRVTFRQAMDVYWTFVPFSPSKMSGKGRKRRKKGKSGNRIRTEAVKASIIVSYQDIKNGRDGES